jgi:hypothetical protein
MEEKEKILENIEKIKIEKEEEKKTRRKRKT